MSGIPLPESGLPALHPLLNQGLWARWSDQGRVFPLEHVRSAVRYLRLKPGISCRLSLFAPGEGGADDPPPGFLLHLFPDAERAATAFEKESHRNHLLARSGFEPFLSISHAAVGVPFPNDPELPALRQVYQPERFRRLLAEVLEEYPEQDWRIKKRRLQTRLIAYKPGRRAVYRIDLQLRQRTTSERVDRVLHARFAPADQIEIVASQHRAIHEGLQGQQAWRVPRPLGTDAQGQMFACAWEEGVLLEQLVCERDRSLSEALPKTGGALASLHRMDVAREHLLSPLEEAESLLALSRDLAAVLPEERSWVEALGDRVAQLVARFVPVPSATVHGDFRLNQVFWSDQGPCLFDFDRTGRGYAAMDLGSVRAHFLELDASPELFAELLRGYEAEANSPVDPELLEIATAVALLRRVNLPLRQLQSDWPERMQQRLRQVETLVRGLSP